MSEIFYSLLNPDPAERTYNPFVLTQQADHRPIPTYPDVEYRYPDVGYRYPDVEYRYPNVEYIPDVGYRTRCLISILDIVNDVVGPESFCLKWRPI